MGKCVEGFAEMSLLKETKMTKEVFLNKFHPDNIIDQELKVTLSDGSVHTFNVPYFTTLNWEFEENEEKAIEIATR